MCRSSPHQMSKRRAVDLDSSSPVRRGPPQSRNLVSTNPPSSDESDSDSDNAHQLIPPAVSLPAPPTYSFLHVPGQAVPASGAAPVLGRAAARTESRRRREQRSAVDAVFGDSGGDGGDDNPDVHPQARRSGRGNVSQPFD